MWSIIVSWKITPQQSMNNTTLCRNMTYNIIQSLCIIYIGGESNPILPHNFIQSLCIIYRRFPQKFMDFSKAATRGILWKKPFLKIPQCSQASCRPVTLSKTHSSTGVFLWILQNFKNIYFEEHLPSEQLLLYWLFYQAKIIY